MNMQKFTQKSIEAIQEAQSVALENQNMQIEEEHLLWALINQQNGFISELLKKMNINVDVIKNELQNAIKSLPAVTGSGREADKVYVSNDVDRGKEQTRVDSSDCPYPRIFSFPYSEGTYILYSSLLIPVLGESNTSAAYCNTGQSTPIFFNATGRIIPPRKFVETMKSGFSSSNHSLKFLSLPKK